MLKIIEIDKTEEVFDYMAGPEGLSDPVFVTPNPQIADIVRTRFDALGKQVESITISKFIKGELNAFLDEEFLQASYKGKTDLILLLGSVWKKIGKSSFHEFKRAFNLLTEFRSFTMSELVLETVLENYDEQLSEGVLWLHRLLNQMDIIDEHRSYFLLSDRLRAGDLPPSYETERSIVFYGFDFMTGSQVDLLKSFGIRDDIYIPFYKKALESSQSSDWIQWLDEHNTERIDLANEVVETSHLKVHEFPKNYLGKSLQAYRDKKNEEFDIVLATKNLEQEILNEVPFSDYATKTGINLFQADFEQAFTFLQNIVEVNGETESVREEIKKEILNASQRHEYRFIKSLMILLNKINAWESLSDENLEITEFDFHILKEAAELDLPRLNRSYLIKEGLNGKIYSLRDIEQIKNRDVVYTLNSNHGSFKGAGANYSENVEKYLISIGPIRRAELEVQIFKAKMSEFIRDNNVVLLIEQMLLEHDSGWSGIFDEYDIVEEKLPLDFNKKVKYIQRSIEYKTVTHVSASKLQKYIECPKKYYETSVAKTIPEVHFDDELNVLELGQVEHEIIEEYFKAFSEFDEESHYELVEKLLNEKSALKKLNAKMQRTYFIEALSYSKNAILFLLNLKEKLAVDFSFEFPFKVSANVTFNGSIDCLVQDPINKTSIIIDFKRSNRVFTSFTSLLEFEQIQLWFYLKRMLDIKKVNAEGDIAVGYIDLSDVENSMFFTKTPEMAKEIKSLGLSKVKAIDDFSEHLEKYNEFEKTHLNNLIEEKNFKAKPFSHKSCEYCSLSAICSRGEE